MSGRPALITRYQLTLTAAHFPTGDETYTFGLELEDGEVALGAGAIASPDWDGQGLSPEPPESILYDDALASSAATTGTITYWILVGEIGLDRTLTPPAVPS